MCAEIHRCSEMVQSINLLANNPMQYIDLNQFAVLRTIGNGNYNYVHMFNSQVLGNFDDLHNKYHNKAYPSICWWFCPFYLHVGYTVINFSRYKFRQRLFTNLLIKQRDICQYYRVNTQWKTSRLFLIVIKCANGFVNWLQTFPFHFVSQIFHLGHCFLRPSLILKNNEVGHCLRLQF